MQGKTLKIPVLKFRDDVIPSKDIVNAVTSLLGMNRFDFNKALFSVCAACDVSDSPASQNLTRKVLKRLLWVKALRKTSGECGEEFHRTKMNIQVFVDSTDGK